MKKIINKIIDEFKDSWFNYIAQSLLAALAIFLALILFNIEQRPIMIASIGATAFIVFAMPASITANTRNVIGGYMVGIVIGSLCAMIPHHSYLSSIIVYALAVGISIFIMVVIDTEHPPASGAALSFVISGFSVKPATTVLLCAVTLTLIHHFFRRYLKDLT